MWNRANHHARVNLIHARVMIRAKEYFPPPKYSMYFPPRLCLDSTLSIERKKAASDGNPGSLSPGQHTSRFEANGCVYAPCTIKTL